MKILALDQSTALGSAAVMDEGSAAAERSWQCGRTRNQGFFQAVRELMGQLSLSAADFDAYAVGTGPGSFSGLRIAMAAARGFALPGAKPVYGVCSAQAVALNVFKEDKPDRVSVLGDARRGQYWVAEFGSSGDIPEMHGDIRLVPYGELATKLGADSMLVSSDWDRLEERVKSEKLREDVKVVAENRFPRASDVGRLVFMGRKSGDIQAVRKPGEILSPIYLHPPTRTIKQPV
ncbi:MAG: tRNA (adenosine(37)-N6)-threonylcarbamoyltransferase complex dimerization subunit type 1 TsaB [Kiritimatiellia bacterium]